MPAADLLGGQTQILRSKGHILFHHGGHDLVVRILEHHPCLFPDVKELVFLPSVHPSHPHLTPGGQQNGVDVLGQGGFPRTVVAQHRHKAPLLYFQVHPVQGQQVGLILPVPVFKGKVFYLNDLFH